jgi:hypothetical protein
MRSSESHGSSVWRVVPALLTACLVVSCGGRQAEPADGGIAPPALPGDHPPISDGGTPPSRLAADTVLAEVGDEAVTAGDVDAAIGAMPGADRLEYTSPEMVRDLVESLVDRKLMAAAARAAALDADPAVQARLGDLAPGSGPEADQVLAAAWMDKELSKVPAPSGSDVAAYYREHASEFRVPARVLVTRATVATEAAAARLQRELARGATAEELRAEAGNDVLDARQVWLQDVQKNSEVTAIALALKAREVSRAVPVPGGFLVMRADRVEAAGQRPLAEVSAGIQASIQDARQRAAADELRERLRRGARIRLDDAALMSYRAP